MNAPVHEPVAAIVVAFDGLVADTLASRALALSEAITAEWGPFSVAQAVAVLPGRSMSDAVEAALPDFPDVAVDHTLRDLAAIRAQRRCTGALALGVSFAPHVIAWLNTQRSGGVRLVLRADSPRRDVEPLLQLGGLDLLFSIVRCADDGPRMRKCSALESSYRAIDARLATALPREHRVAVEPSLEGAEVAGLFAATVHRTVPYQSLIPPHCVKD